MTMTERRTYHRTTLVAILVILLGGGVVEDVGASQRNEIVTRDAAAWGDCPADSVCLWDLANYDGRMVAFIHCCDWINLADHDFNNKMTSWRNRKSVDAKVAQWSDGNGDRLCLGSSSSNASVGSAWNNEATSIKIFSGSGAC